MRIWLAVGLALAAALSLWAYDRAGQVRRVDALERRLDQSLAENRLRRPGEPPRTEEPKDLATWAAEIDRMVQESYGHLLRLSLSEAQIRGIVQDLKNRVESGEAVDLAQPRLRAELKGLVDKVVSEHLYEKGYILKRRTPALKEVAEKIELDPSQWDSFERIFSDTRASIMDLASAKRADGVDLMADLYKLESMPLASPEREPLVWRLSRLPVAQGRTFHDWLADQERLVATRVDGILTADQRARFAWFNFVPWDLVGIALQTTAHQ